MRKVGTCTPSTWTSVAMTRSTRSTPLSCQRAIIIAATIDSNDPIHTTRNNGWLCWITRSITWNARMKAASSNLLRPGITTAANANRKPATSEHRTVATTRSVSKAIDMRSTLCGGALMNDRRRVQRPFQQRDQPPRTVALGIERGIVDGQRQTHGPRMLDERSQQAHHFVEQRSAWLR